MGKKCPESLRHSLHYPLASSMICHPLYKNFYFSSLKIVLFSSIITFRNYRIMCRGGSIFFHCSRLLVGLFIQKTSPFIWRIIYWINLFPHPFFLPLFSLKGAHFIQMLRFQTWPSNFLIFSSLLLINVSFWSTLWEASLILFSSHYICYV